MVLKNVNYTSAVENKFDKVTDNVTDRVADRVTDFLDENALHVFALLQENPTYTAAVIGEKLSLSRKTISAKLKKLKELSYIERVGSDRKGYWKLLK